MVTTERFIMLYYCRRRTSYNKSDPEIGPPIWRHTYLAPMKTCEQKFPIIQYFDLRPYRHIPTNYGEETVELHQSLGLHTFYLFMYLWLSVS